MASRNDSRYSSELNYNSEYANNYKQPTDGYQYNPWDFENPWAHGLYNCTDNCDESCYSIWCFPCFVCHLAWRMNESCWITFFLPGHLAVLRTKMRTAFRINGTYLSDFCASECCPCCTAVQMAGELRFRRVMS